jgi:hypothetical protein
VIAKAPLPAFPDAKTIARICLGIAAMPNPRSFLHLLSRLRNRCVLPLFVDLIPDAP